MVGTSVQILQWLFQQKGHLFEIHEWKEKRSNNANKYCWVLCQKIADATGSTKEEVYLICLKRYGQSVLLPLVKDTNPDEFFRGITKYYEFHESGTLNGKDCDWYKVYRGSSEYNTKEMSVFLDGIVSECKELDIETLPPQLLDGMKERW